MTYRVAQDQPCNWPTMYDEGVCEARHPCDGCRGDGTRMVEVAVVELLDDGRCTEMRQNMFGNCIGCGANTNDGPHEDRRPVWVEVEP